MPWPSRKIPLRRTPWEPPTKPPPAPSTVRLMRGGREIHLDAEIGALFVRYEVTLHDLVKALQADPASRGLHPDTRNLIDQAHRARFGHG